MANVMTAFSALWQARSARRLALTMGAQVFNQIVTVAAQVLTVPVLLRFWGVEKYGVWLLLSTIPAYLMLSDLGFTYIAKNEMTMSVAAGDKQRALVTYHSIFALLGVVATLVCVMVFGVVSAVRLSSVWSLGSTSEGTAKAVILLLGLSVVMFQYFLLLSGAVRCIGRPATEVSWTASARLSETLVVCLVALFGGELVAAASAIVINRIAFNCIILLWLRKVAPWLRLGFGFSSRAEVSRLVHPSISYMSLVIGHALMLQGPVLAIGSEIGTTSVVVFSTSRTLVRLGTSVANVLNYSFIPEFTRLFGRGERASVRRLVRFAIIAMVVFVAVFSVVVLIAGGTILRLWTASRVTVVEPLFAILIFAIDCEIIWGTLFAPLAAINRHISVCYAFSIVSVLAVAASFGLARVGGLTGASAPILLAHLVMIFIAANSLTKQLPRGGNQVEEHRGATALQP